MQSQASSCNLTCEDFGEFALLRLSSLGPDEVAKLAEYLGSIPPAKSYVVYFDLTSVSSPDPECLDQIAQHIASTVQTATRLEVVVVTDPASVPAIRASTLMQVAEVVERDPPEVRLLKIIQAVETHDRAVLGELEQQITTAIEKAIVGWTGVQPTAIQSTTRERTIPGFASRSVLTIDGMEIMTVVSIPGPTLVQFLSSFLHKEIVHLEPELIDGVSEFLNYFCANLRQLMHADAESIQATPPVMLSHEQILLEEFPQGVQDLREIQTPHGTFTLLVARDVA